MALPLTVVGGFLGAGKTTLLQHWLRHALGQRLALLVNDFGALNIDAGLVAERGANTIALSNGCVCCQTGGDLSAALLDVLQRAGDFDAVVVEASGVSDPARIAALGGADPDLRLDAVLVLADATAVVEQARDPLLADTLMRQWRSAGLLLLNKCDLADAPTVAAARAVLQAAAPGVPIVECAQAEVPLALLNSQHLQPVPVHECGHGAHLHGPDCEPAHGAQFESWQARPQQLFDPAALRAWLRAPPSGLLRLKGWLRTSATACSEIQLAGRHGSLRPSTVAPADAALVAIGLRGQLPRAVLESSFRLSLEDTP